VNRWADHHGAILQADLQDGEQLLVAARVAVARRSAGMATFPVPGRVFVLGLSERRLLFWRASKWLGRPGGLMTSVELDQVASLDRVSRFGSPRLRVALATGSVLLLESTWGGSVRTLRDTFQALRGHR
jgi:hypothetical protein